MLALFMNEGYVNLIAQLRNIIEESVRLDSSLDRTYDMDL